MLISHYDFLLNDARKICNRNDIQLIENKNYTFEVNNKHCKSLKLALSKIYSIEAKK